MHHSLFWNLVPMVIFAWNEAVYLIYTLFFPFISCSVTRITFPIYVYYTLYILANSKVLHLYLKVLHILESPLRYNILWSLCILFHHTAMRQRKTNFVNSMACKRLWHQYTISKILKIFWGVLGGWLLQMHVRTYRFFFFT